MDVTQFEEILALLHSIADNAMANKIAFISVLISGIAVVSSIYFSHQTRVQYIESLSPLLSFNLVEEGMLYLIVTNTGQSEATDIEISFKELKNNGEKNELTIDNVFKNSLTLYPNEQITGYVAVSGRNIKTAIAPMLRVHVSYRKGNTQKMEQYSRWICYSGNINDNNSFERNLESISQKLNEISYSNNRMANYFEGKFLLKTDEISAYPYSSLYQDMKDAVNNSERRSDKKSGRDETGELSLK